MVLARMLWEFDMRLDEAEYAGEAVGKEEEGEGCRVREGVGKWQEEQCVFLIWKKGPLMVELVPRR